MTTAITRLPLSGSTDGRPIKVAATAISGDSQRISCEGWGRGSSRCMRSGFHWMGQGGIGKQAGHLHAD